MSDISNAIHVHLGGVLQKFVHEHGAFGEASTAKRM